MVENLCFICFQQDSLANSPLLSKAIQSLLREKTSTRLQSGICHSVLKCYLAQEKH